MNTETIIEKLRQQVNYASKKLEAFTRFAEGNKEKLSPVECSLSVMALDKLDFNFPTRSDVEYLLKALGGKWNKEKFGRGIHYERTEPYYGFNIRLFQAEVPPRCHIEKKIVHHEAYDEEVEEVVCPVYE